MMIDVVWQSYNPEAPNRGYWDMAMLEDLFSGRLWTPALSYEFSHRDGFSELPSSASGAIVVLPARHQTQYVDRLNADIARLSWVIIVLVGDEESLFPCEKIEHPRMKLWVMSPLQGKHDSADRRLINGYSPATRPVLARAFAAYERKSRDFFFSGQVRDNLRRQECVAQLLSLGSGTVNATAGFTQGLDAETYHLQMAEAKIVPCPSGPQTPDTFRFAEALEAGCIPVPDSKVSGKDYPSGFWNYVFQTPVLPFPIVEDYPALPAMIENLIRDWPADANKVFAWWQAYKRSMSYWLTEDITTLRGKAPIIEEIDGQITVLIPTSPIKAHPDTSIIENTIASVRHHLPKAEILLLIDGVRDEQRDYATRYKEYIRRILWKCNYEWHNILPCVFSEYRHQVAMTRFALECYVKTPLILFVEHDTPLVIDEPIEWEGIVKTLLEGFANSIRFLHEAHILEAHKHLTLETVTRNQVRLTKTYQWSQRPHLASVDFYRKVLREHFSPDARTFIEDKMHGVAQSLPWEACKLAIYNPNDTNIKRSYHTDGRGGDSKLGMVF